MLWRNFCTVLIHTDAIFFEQFQRSQDDLYKTLGFSAKWASDANKNSILFDPCLRKLVNESCGTFLSGQKFAQNLDSGGDHGPELLKLSRRYRCVEVIEFSSFINWFL